MKSKIEKLVKQISWDYANEKVVGKINEIIDHLNSQDQEEEKIIVNSQIVDVKPVNGVVRLKHTLKSDGKKVTHEVKQSNMEKKEIRKWRDRLVKMFGVYHSDGQEYVTCPLCGINLDELANHMIKELDRAREEGLKEVLEWNKLQEKRWGKHEDDFGKGVLSGYGWSNQHIEHLITGEECKCPI